MPAYSERVYLCPRQHGHPGWIEKYPLWWDRRAFFEKYGERQIDTGNPFSVDYGLLLTVGEAMAWDKRCRETFEIPPMNKESILEAMTRWTALLKTAAWVIVERYEWESGYD